MTTLYSIPGVPSTVLAKPATDLTKEEIAARNAALDDVIKKMYELKVSRGRSHYANEIEAAEGKRAKAREYYIKHKDEIKKKNAEYRAKKKKAQEAPKMDTFKLLF